MMRGSPGPMELTLRSNISEYLSAIQKQLSESGNQVLGNSSYTDRVKSYADDIYRYDEQLAAALINVHGKLVLNSDFRTANAEPVLYAVQRVKDLLKAENVTPVERVREEKGLWSRLKPRKRRSKL